MPMYHDNPNYAELNRFAWFSVETPGVFEEVKLPASETDWTAKHKRQYARLEDLAERHGTHVQCHAFRRG